MILKCAACGYCYEPNPSSNANLDYCPKCGGGRWFIKPGDPDQAEYRGAVLERPETPSWLGGICTSSGA